jgi:hypothetical protein
VVLNAEVVDCKNADTGVSATAFRFREVSLTVHWNDPSISVIIWAVSCSLFIVAIFPYTFAAKEIIGTVRGTMVKYFTAEADRKGHSDF